LIKQEDDEMNKKITGKALFPVILACLFIASAALYSCGGANPAFAPFGSTITMLQPPGDITIPPNSLEPLRIQAIVLNPEGEPINDVRVFWDLSFAGENSLVVDTNGDGVSDARALQLVNNNACSPQQCLLTPISEWFAMGAFVDSPFDILTDNRGIAFVVILVSGDVIIDPATLAASTDSGAIEIVTFTVNADNDN
jgi:hypothetical protein